MIERLFDTFGSRSWFAGIPLLVALLLAGLSTGGCSKQDSTGSAADSSAAAGRPAAASPQASAVPGVQLTFTYGSEKKAWISEATAAFNAAAHKVGSGKVISVDAIPMGSGECIDELLNNTRQADLVSPASGAFVKLGNAQSRVKTGADLIGPTDNLVLSPVVVAMWKPMAEST